MRKLANFAYRRRVLLALAAGLIALASALGGTSVFDRVKSFGFQDPDSDSARAYDELESVTGERALPDVELLVQAKGAAATPDTAAAARKLRSVSGISQVFTPAVDPSLTSNDGRAALVLGFVDKDVEDTSDVGADVRKRFAGDQGVVVGGGAATVDQLTETTQDDLRRIELYALPLLLLLSLLVFRGLVAALLPVAVGALSILTTLLLLNLLTAAIEIDTFAINIVTGLGLGLAIDYSLFLVTRFREELARRRATEAALAATMASTGGMVVFSGITVAVSMISLCVFPQRFLYSIGVGGALVALSSAAVCLLLLPALLALLGHRVNALAPPALQRPPSERGWLGLARLVLRHPAGVALLAIALMVAAGVPFLRVELTQADATVLPSDASARRVNDIVAARFASNPADRIVVVASANDPATTRHAASELAADRAIGRVDVHRLRDSDWLRVDAQLTVDPFSDPALDSARRARSLDWDGAALVAGPPAELLDQRHSLASHLPLALAFIIVSTAMILLVMTRSVVLPVVALLMNTLTVSVAFGVLVFVFQDGRLQSPLDYMSQGALDTSMPILLFAVAFGLSTDYGVFLLQRIAEARRQPGSEAKAIATGVARSGRTITTAALLFAVAMGAFAFSELVYVKEVAVGAAVAVLVDATVVRALLFPAILGLLGARAWWAPRWLVAPRTGRR